jgi:two-component system CheB/CheR fusion protein
MPTKKRTPKAARPRTVATPPATVEQTEHRNYLVGIGSSAGGLEALTALINALPVDLGLSYVVIQHMSPTHRSMMVQLLSRETAMAVLEIEDGVRPEPNVIYVAPSSRNTVFQEGHFKLLETKREALPKPSVNVFFSSLASEKGEDAIGVILSGTGSDGTVGIREIKASGGFTFAQQPDTAKYDGMPQSAIDSGCVDWILPAEGIAREIAAIAHNLPPSISPEQPQSPATSLKKLLMKIKQHTRIDFGGYKEGTLWRRIERRMSANHLSRFEDYLQLVEVQPNELDRLGKDILISVTAFFRDPDAFTKLKEVLRAIVAGKQIGDEIRIWVAACATGEEAYSIAILLAEVLGPNSNNFKIQIFATDIDNNAMSIARKGIYIEGALAELDPALVGRYFQAHRGRFEISRTLRDMVVFARQDLVQDPPFLRLDLVSCRNMLIYLQNELQAKVLSTFHYGLRNGGYLFLGKSEGIFQQENLFDTVDKNSRMYRRKSGDNRDNRLPSLTYRLPDIAEQGDKPRKPDIEQRLIEAAIRTYVPATILVNSNLEIQHIYGDVTEFITVLPGKPSFNLQHMMRRELRTDLQLLQHHAEKTLQSAVGRARSYQFGDLQRKVRLAVHPLEKGVMTQLYLISFEAVQLDDRPDSVAREAANLDSEVNSSTRELEDELIMTRERLQTVIEELETSNEEMQALNEEVQAANEELQSSNEELEAANEELQSTNEELTTVNEELQIRSAELDEALNSLERVQNCVGFPILVVNEQLRLQRFNSPAAAMFSLAKPSIGQPLNSVRLPPGMSDFSAAVVRALQSSTMVEEPLFSNERHYHLHVSPYETAIPGSHGAIITLVDNTEQLALDREVRENRDRLLSIMNNSTSIITMKDLAGRYEFVNHQFEQVFRKSAADVIGKTDAQIFTPRIADEFRAKELEVARRQKPIEYEDHIPLHEGDRYLLAIRFPLIGADQIIYGICTQATDITARKKAEQQLQLAARVFDRSSEGIVVTDADQRILTVNDAFTKVTGYTSQEVVGKKPRMFKSGRQGPEFYQAMWESIITQSWWQGEIWNRRKNGEIFPEWLTINAVHDADGNVINYIGLFSDISVVKESQQRVEFLATHDELTGLPNRALFLDRVHQMVARAQRQQINFSVLFIDLDNFKVVNDSLGHSAGDQLLKEIARRLGDCVRTVDSVARFGGDEFAMLIESATISEAELMAQRIGSELAKTICIAGEDLVASASIGICMYPEDGDTAEILLKNADAAMYQAKEAGKSMYRFFTADLKLAADDRLRIESSLRQGIKHGELELFYQPLIALDDGHLAGIEALVRWNHPEQGLLLPERFLPMAEKSQLIEQISEWVLNRACQQLASWEKYGSQVPRLSINVSAEEFRRGRLAALLSRQLNLHELSADRLAIEITEPALMHDTEHQRLKALKELGVHLSIDDFGTGFSSLTCLRLYPVDELKIHTSFVADIVDSADARTIARTVIAMAQSLGMQVIAEGVETQAQRDVLHELGCRIGQGYFFAAPMTATAFEERYLR